MERDKRTTITYRFESSDLGRSKLYFKNWDSLQIEFSTAENWKEFILQFSADMRKSTPDTRFRFVYDDSFGIGVDVECVVDRERCLTVFEEGMIRTSIGLHTDIDMLESHKRVW